MSPFKSALYNRESKPTRSSYLHHHLPLGPPTQSTPPDPSPSPHGALLTWSSWIRHNHIGSIHMFVESNEVASEDTAVLGDALHPVVMCCSISLLCPQSRWWVWPSIPAGHGSPPALQQPTSQRRSVFLTVADQSPCYKWGDPDSWGGFVWDVTCRPGYLLIMMRPSGADFAVQKVFFLFKTVLQIDKIARAVFSLGRILL